MRQHVVIRRESYVAGTRERPEVGIFTQSHSTRPPVPWDKIAPGDKVWMKWSGGPIVATAHVRAFRQIADCTPQRLRETTKGYRLHALEEYWRSLPWRFFAVVVYLSDEEWLDQVIVPQARSRGESWIVLSTPQLVAQWLPAAAEPDRVAALDLDRARRARGPRTAPPALRFQVLRRDGFACTYCGRRPRDVELRVDHVVPWAAGGETRLENLRTACTDCNAGKGAQVLRSDEIAAC